MTEEIVGEHLVDPVFALTVIQTRNWTISSTLLFFSLSFPPQQIGSRHRQAAAQTYKQTEAEVRSQHSATTDELFGRVDNRANGGAADVL